MKLATMTRAIGLSAALTHAIAHGSGADGGGDSAPTEAHGGGGGGGGGRGRVRGNANRNLVNLDDNLEVAAEEDGVAKGNDGRDRAEEDFLFQEEDEKYWDRFLQASVSLPPALECDAEVSIECKVDASLTIVDGSTDCNDIGAIATQCDQRPTKLTMKYTGGPCSESFNNQDSDLYFCDEVSGAFPNTDDVYIKVTSNKDPNIVYYAGIVSPNDTYDIIPPNNLDMDADSIITVWPDQNTAEECGTIGGTAGEPVNIEDFITCGGLQLVYFHTSCSRNLFLKDVYGSSQLVAFENDNQGFVSCFLDAELDIVVNNEGTSAFDITTFDVSFTDAEGTTTFDCLDEIDDANAVPPQGSIMAPKAIRLDMTVRQSYLADVVLEVETTPGQAGCGDEDETTWISGNPPPADTAGDF